VTATADLERLARTLVQPSGTRGAVAVVDHTPGGRLSKPLDSYPSGIGGRTRWGAAWQVDGGRGMPITIALFDRQADAHRLVRLINGTTSTSRPASRVPVSEEPAEVPTSRGASPSLPVTATNSVAVEPEPATELCAGCGKPIPPGRHGQRRLTCSAACRQRASRSGRDPDLIAATGAARNANARARAYGRSDEISPEDILDLWALEPACIWCGQGRGLDHVSPLVAGGANTRANLQNLCPSCNSRKAIAERPAPGQGDPAGLSAGTGASVPPVTPSDGSTEPTPLEAQPAARESGVPTQLPIFGG
jgi:5-methylcytosine-specific restriction endonuclease McrA